MYMLYVRVRECTWSHQQQQQQQQQQQHTVGAISAPVWPCSIEQYQMANYCVDKAVKGLGKADAFANDTQALFCNQMLCNMLCYVMLTAVNNTMHATCSVAGR
jgi:hypothetical protein